MPAVGLCTDKAISNCRLGTHIIVHCQLLHQFRLDSRRHDDDNLFEDAAAAPMKARLAFGSLE